MTFRDAISFSMIVCMLGMSYMLLTEVIIQNEIQTNSINTQDITLTSLDTFIEDNNILIVVSKSCLDSQLFSSCVECDINIKNNNSISFMCNKYTPTRE